METKRCKSCGAQIYADETACPYCGMTEFEGETKAQETPGTKLSRIPSPPEMRTC